VVRKRFVTTCYSTHPPIRTLLWAALSGGFNTPVGMDRPAQRGFNKIRQMYNRSEGDDTA
jgi:hypothetical protein